MIKKLSDEVIGKIAAGEVIERPAYIVKELIENSIDAKATTVHVNLKDGGNQYIQVIDNGEGIPAREIHQAVLPHYTSKIKSLVDLTKVKSYGFRGEALASIAAISDITIESRTNTSVGKSIRLIKGKPSKPEPVGISVGTRITVKNIFSHVPARKKFMKSAQSELRLILQMVTRFALAHPSVEFIVTNNGKDVVRVPKASAQKDRVASLFGDSVVSDLIPTTREDSYLTIQGFISRPQRTYKTAQHIHIIVNGRPVEDAIIVAAIKDAYEHLLSRDEYPFSVCMITTPPEYVDVNIHPRKERVAFYNQQEVYEFVYKSTKDALTGANLTFSNVGWKKYAPLSSLKTALTGDPISALGSIPSTENVLQIADTYLFVETDDGVMIIDQHAAHEAILYRSLLTLFESDSTQNKSVVLKEPLLISQSAQEIAALTETRETLQSIGFDVEAFGPDAIRVFAIPQIIKGYDIAQFLTEYFDMSHDVTRNKLDSQTRRILSTMACKSAIKAGQRLTLKQRKDLITRLQVEDYVYTCPHGRPVKIEITTTALARMFKR